MASTQQKLVNGSTRPTKKQKLLLDYISDFISQHGYSPSYREIKSGMNYNSVATVALHVNSLVSRGHLIKRDHSARSLEPVKLPDESTNTNQITASEEKWLVKKVEYFFVLAEQVTVPEIEQVDQLYVLVGSLKILGFDGAANSFIPRLTNLKNKLNKKHK
jgi:SOS-response transcriptional repressor LexA